MTLTDRERTIRQRLKDDFAHYASKCLKIRSKSGEVLPLVLNSAQRYIHERLEEQLRTTGRIRALILKGRQQGCSTYVEGRFYHKVSHRRGARAFILTHLDEATNNLFGMAKRYHEHCPQLVKPSTTASNARELVFNKLDSGYKIGTAGSKGTGRSDTIQYFHGSEVAYWPNAETHMAGVLQAIPNELGTEIILESTSAGAEGLFYEMCKAAMAGQGEYQLIFVPWFWQDEYRARVPIDFEATEEERQYSEAYGLDNEQLVWRRNKIIELRGVGNFRREYPATPEEAFRADAEGALWQREQIERLRVHQAPDMLRIVVAIDPAVTANPTSCETGIIVAGLGVDYHGYILADYSGKYTPAEWASKACTAFHKFQADRIVGEVNNGGDLVEVNIRTVDPDAPYLAVHASRGKRSRAEPVAALDEQGRIHHVGTHAELEDQMVTWEPAKDNLSPDRIDARVWGIWALMLTGENVDTTSVDLVQTYQWGHSDTGLEYNFGE